MDPKFTEWFVCTECGSPLRAEVSSSAQNNGTIVEGQLVCTSCARTFPIVRSMPRFVPSEEYARTFGYQWNRFDKLQLDRHMGNDLSRDMFSPVHDHPQTIETVRQWFADAGLVDVYVGTGFNGINARGRKP